MSTPQGPEESSDLPLARRVAEAVVLGCITTVIYFGVGERMLPSPVPLAHAIDGEIPFVPATVWIYLPGYLGTFLITLWAVRDARQYRATLTAVGMLTLLALPFFAMFPVAAPRPPIPADVSLTAEMVRWLYTHDPNGNTFPSLHVANATLCAIVTTAANRRWGVLTWLLAAGVWVSVLTLKQHWVIDVPAGWALAAVGAATWRAQLLAPSVLAGLPSRVVRAAPAQPFAERARLIARFNARDRHP
jgi:membrane-associated phospholipid phosphatase